MAANFSSTAPRGESGSVDAQPMAQGDVQAIGQKRDQDVRFDAVLELVEDGPDRQIAFEIFEGFLDLGQLHVGRPE